jgi:pyruvate-formate lyase-activating enzyme
MSATPPVAAALAGVPVALQQMGAWSGRRQLFIKFAGPAETAMMYTADALTRELQRAIERSHVHSICISGRDALANDAFLVASLAQLKTDVPVMLDTDGQRPANIEKLQPYVKFVQLSVDTSVEGAALERVVESVKHCERLGLVCTVAISGRDNASDSDYLRIVESIAAANAKVAIVLHPSPAEERKPLDRRWSMLVEQASMRLRDVRVVLRLNGPVTPR